MVLRAPPPFTGVPVHHCADRSPPQSMEVRAFDQARVVQRAGRIPDALYIVRQGRVVVEQAPPVGEGAFHARDGGGGARRACAEPNSV